MSRVFDVLVASVGLIVLAPLLLVISIAVMVTSPGGIFHRAARVGQGGLPFTLFKFRTMRVASGPAITRFGDPRITSVGGWLRRTKLDELPQLLNVLRGDMALVGPRPEDPKYVEKYSDEQREILRYRPGITSAASLQYRNEEAMLLGDDWETQYTSEIMPAKIATDLAYLRRRTLLTDSRLILRTIGAVFR